MKTLLYCTMNNINTVSSQVTLAGIETIFKFGTSGWQGDALEFIGQGIKGIGYHTGFEEFDDLVLKVKNYRVKIPCEIESITGICKEGCPVVLAYDDDQLVDKSKQKYNIVTYEETLELNKLVDRILFLRDRIESEPLDAMNPDYSDIEALDTALHQYQIAMNNIGLADNHRYFKGDYFYTKGGFIKTSFPEGEITISGTRIGVDEEGYPLVINTYKYQKALEWFVVYQMLLGTYDHPKIRWQEAEARWDHFRQQAANEAKIMGKLELDRFLNRWLSLTKSQDARYIKWIR
jgi:hypothetical protein